MATSWAEVSAVKAAGRRELVLTGPKISEKIEKNGLDRNIYSIETLNFLEISNTSLSVVEPEVGALINLTSLVLCNNKISEIPADIGKLSKLKILNLSNNQIQSIPTFFSSLPELDTLNLSMNKLSSLPCVKELKSIHIFNVAYNQLESLPDGLYDQSLVHLSQIIANDNNIREVLSDVENLPHLNVLDLSNNCLTSSPPELCNCTKLKELNLKGNKFSDKKFLKTVEKGTTKSVLSYLETELKKSGKGAKGGKVSDKKSKKKKKGPKEEEDKVVEIVKNMFNLLRMPNESKAIVTVTPAAMSVRPYIVCCIVRNLDLQASDSTFKNFISLQVSFHSYIGFSLFLNDKF